MAYTVKVKEEGAEIDIIKDVNDVSFVGEYMIMCLSDMRTRLVRHLSKILYYEIIEQPVVNPHKVKGPAKA